MDVIKDPNKLDKNDPYHGIVEHIANDFRPFLNGDLCKSLTEY